MRDKEKFCRGSGQARTPNPCGCYNLTVITRTARGHLAGERNWREKKKALHYLLILEEPPFQILYLSQGALALG